MKEGLGSALLQLTKELLALTVRLLWLLTRTLARWFWMALRWLYRYRQQIIGYKYTPAIVAFLCMIWFFFGPKPATIHSAQPEVYSSNLTSYDHSRVPTSHPAWVAEYKDLTGSFPDKRSNLRLSHAIHTWLGTPQCDGGNTRKGTDCSGFVQAVFRDVYGVELSRSAADMYTHDALPISRRKLKQGDLVFFNIGGSRISHVGIYLTNDRFAHTSTTRGVRISSLQEPYYRKYFYRAGRVRITEL